MVSKVPIVAERIRKVPPHFSWIDHQLIRQHRLRDCDHRAWALYLFLVTVADAQGFSYYSEASLSRALKLEASGLSAARRQLIDVELIAYHKPLYQVLGLGEKTDVPTVPRSGQVRSIAEVLAAALSGGGA